MARPGSESIGESRGYWLCRVFHLPAPKPQFKVVRRRGVLKGTCDWGWPEHGLLGEFDGRIKYGRLLKPGQEPGEVVFAEKRREDLLRELTGYGMVRLIWSDYERPRATAARIERQLRRAAADGSRPDPASPPPVAFLPVHHGLVHHGMQGSHRFPR